MRRSRHWCGFHCNATVYVLFGINEVSAWSMVMYCNPKLYPSLQILIHMLRSKLIHNIHSVVKRRPPQNIRSLYIGMTYKIRRSGELSSIYPYRDILRCNRLCIQTIGSGIISRCWWSTEERERESVFIFIHPKHITERQHQWWCRRKTHTQFTQYTYIHNVDEDEGEINQGNVFKIYNSER